MATGRILRKSNNILAAFNLLTGILSIAVIVVGIWLSTRHHIDCIAFLEWPFIVLGSILLMISMIGLLAASRRIVWLLLTYLTLMFIIIVLLFCFTILALVVTGKGDGHPVAGARFKEYELGDFSTWLQNRVKKASNWERIHRCLADGKFCDNLNKEYRTRKDFYRANLSPVESGCCKPPTACHFTFVNPTTWDRSPVTWFYYGREGANADCRRWSNSRAKLCFSCDACKAGVLGNVKQHWLKVATVGFVVLILLMIVYSIGCCALSNARNRSLPDDSSPKANTHNVFI